MSQNLANQLSQEFQAITKINCTATYMEKGVNHIPSILRGNQQGVYVFLMNEQICFKVGKAGAKSQARWNSHHYNLDATTKSSFAKSFINGKNKIKSYFTEIQQNEIDNLNSNNIKIWIRLNMSRIEFKISSVESPFVLNFLEAFIMFKLKPIFEGKSN